LLPVDKNFADQNIKFAQTNFAIQAKEYLLGEHAFPHITLCQFEEDPNRIHEIWSALSSLSNKTLSIKLGPFYVLLHENAYWAGLGTERLPELINLQLSVNEILNTLQIKSKQPHSTYFPHITWARCTDTKPPEIKILPNAEFWNQSYSFVLSIGQSSPYGVYRKILFISDLK
jgi:2'-5' RNA ligase